MKKSSPILLGAHVSIADSIDLAIDRGQALDCTTIQIFVKNNRQWAPPKISVSAANLFKKKQSDSNIRTVITHGCYLVNLCSENKDVQKKSVNTLIKELEACDLLNIPYLVLHPGSAKDNDATKIIADQINKIYEHNDFKVNLLLETMSGQGSSIGKTFEELKQILDQLSPKVKEKIGICFDTCHVFAAGYNLNNYDKVFNEFDKTIGLDLLKVFHINDSKKECGSFVDRHEDIAKGKIGYEFFKTLMNDPHFYSIPKIIETPKETANEDLKNLHTLRDMVDKNK